ncbi:hypothetical protein [Thiohalomonas denitrificans]|uniref:Uncharacterized protein n=1 Tax=Thiohalomonas denitrificans TaxID=415747 RepID=A0A1G5QR27_9GAMM|nr:hypothetical protein [Thiohalomonas denitrificans]SCZ64202.1 hypothetical protein SAMN03097708_02584 [Thiohalomonas denitrificans]
MTTTVCRFTMQQPIIANEGILMDLKKLAKRAFWTLVFLFPFFWLVFTDEGQRFGDVLLLKLTGREEVRINFDELYPSVTEAQLGQVWPDLEFQCQDQASAFGSRLCATDIAAFNKIPSRYVTFFFADERLQAMKIGYQRAYHGAITAHLDGMLGAPMMSSRTDGDGVYQWRAGGGIVVMPQEKLGKNDEPALLWLAKSG